MVLAKSVLSALAVSVALADAAAVPRNSTSNNKGFTLAQTAVKGKHISPAAQYARALRRYNATVPSHVASAAQAGSVPANSVNNDEQYVIKVTAGDSTLNLDLDTGSADLWTFSSETPESDIGGHNIYQPSASAQELDGESWQISYGDGSSAGGNVYADKVTIGGVSYDKQAVEAAQQVSQEFVSDSATDGLIGMAFSKINTVQPVQQKTFFDNVKPSLGEPLFTASLKHDQPGSYDFGYIDHSKYTGQLAFTDVDNSMGFWGFTVDGYQVGSGSGGNGGGGGGGWGWPWPSKRQFGNQISAIADTGTTLLMVDSSIVSDYYSQVEGAQDNTEIGGYTFPCSTNLPDLSFTIGNYQATIPGSLMSYMDLGGTCYGGIQSNQGIGLSIFGDIFLKSQFVVFENGDSPRIGFAKQA